MKRLVAVFLAVSVLFSLSSASVFATETLKDNGKTTLVEQTEGTEGQQLSGWVSNEDGSKSYYDITTHEAAIGLKTIEGKKYYFTSDGKLQIGKRVQNISGKLYYFNASGAATTTAKNKWFGKSNGVYQYYSLGGGVIASGVKKIGKILYYFKTSNGKIGTKGFVTYNGQKYYCLGKGKLATGWRAIGKNAYYFSKKTGKMAKNTKVGYLKIPKSGKLGTAYASGIKVLNKNGWSLKSAYKYSYKLKYANRWMRKKTSEEFANYGFKNKKGNCYVMAATFYVQAKLLGYNVRQIKGRVSMPHSWTEIKHGKKWYVYDPNFRNETGRSGWKLKYGQRGTWRYNSYSVFQTANKTNI